MFKNKFIIIKFKELFFPLLICCFTALLLIFSGSNIQATKSGITLWYSAVLPSLLPFFIATELLGYTNLISYLGKYLSKIMRPVFNVPGEGAFPLVMGIISGYPVGAKIVADFKEKKIISPIEAERLLAFTNNSGPLFILGTVGISLFQNKAIGIILLITHILASLTVGFVFRWWKYNKTLNRFDDTIDLNKNLSFANLGEILSKSITSSIKTIVLIGGFIVLFSVIISIIKSTAILNLLSPILSFFNIPAQYFNGIFFGLLELTNGINLISSIPHKMLTLNIVLCAFILGFGGLSVLLQVLSITSKNKIPIKSYFIGKLLHGIFAASYTFLLFNYLPIINLDL